MGRLSDVVAVAVDSKVASLKGAGAAEKADRLFLRKLISAFKLQVAFVENPMQFFAHIEEICRMKLRGRSRSCGGNQGKSQSRDGGQPLSCYHHFIYREETKFCKEILNSADPVNNGQQKG